MKASLAGGGSRAVESAGPTTESGCRAVDSTGVQGLWPCLERKWQWMGTMSTTTMIAICCCFPYCFAGTRHCGGVHAICRSSGCTCALWKPVAAMACGRWLWQTCGCRACGRWLWKALAAGAMLPRALLFSRTASADRTRKAGDRRSGPVIHRTVSQRWPRLRQC